MRPHGHARISARYPQALGRCDNCGFIFNHSDLQWQYEWRGPKLVNERKLVCATCNDKPFEHHRTIILPPDPTPIANPRPENYTLADNPVSYAGWEPLALFTTPTESGNIGTLRNTDAAFRLPTNKGSGISAYLDVTSTDALTSSGTNYVGKNWGAQTGGFAIVPSPLTDYGIKYNISSFTAQAPSDAAFLAGGPTFYAFQGWDGTAWQGLWADTTAGTAGETIAITIPSTLQGQYYGHRFAILGDGTRATIASLTMSAAGEGVRSSAPATVPS